MLVKEATGDPDVNLPMDRITSGYVLGTFRVKVIGSGTIHSFYGIKSQSLSFPRDAYLNYGKNNVNTCFHLPDHCPQGVTFSVWLWLYDSMAGARNIVLSSDTNGHDDIGYRIKYKAHKNIIQVTLGTKLVYRRAEIYIDTGRWVHIAFTWHPADIMRVYANGCTAGHAFGKSTTIHVVEKEFLIGGKGDGWGTAEMKIDDLLIWYKELAHDQIWYIFEHGLQW